MTLGKHPGMTLVEARTAARDALALVEQGIDPRKTKIIDGVAVAAAEPAQHTVAEVAAKYIEKRLKPRARRWADVEGMLRRDVLSEWGTRPIAEITRRDVRDLLEGIVGRGSPVVANRVLSHLRGLFRWAIRNDYVTVNPAVDIDRPHDEKPRQRALSEAEIKTAWQAFCKMRHPFGTLGKMLLLTAARRGEWAGASWSEIDVERAIWTLPASRSKTGEPLMLPLSSKVIEIVVAIPRIDSSDLLFPSSRSNSANPISGFSKELVAAHRLSGTSGWHWHDLRRTCRTGFARLGVTAAVGERILNHSDGTRNRIAAVYDAHSYLPEMRAALEAWASELERIVSGVEPKVVALHGRAG
jgi:integrase